MRDFTLKQTEEFVQRRSRSFFLPLPISHSLSPSLHKQLQNTRSIFSSVKVHRCIAINKARCVYFAYMPANNTLLVLTYRQVYGVCVGSHV